jgi:hypothetical protein
MAKRKKPVAPVDAYVNAISFRAAVVALSLSGANQGVDQILLYWPTVVCEAFELELLIKCLHATRRRRPKKHHDIEALYNALSRADRKVIAKRYHEIVKAHRHYELALKHGVCFDIAFVLQRTKYTFVRVRYWHEKEPPSADDTGKVSNAGAGSLCDAIYEFIREIRPEWKNIALQIPVLMENLPLPT